MTLLMNGRKLSKSYGTDPLFESLDLSIFESDKLAIIGPNGVGKSTLLKIMAGVESPDEGEVVVKKSVRVVYVPQHRVFEESDTVIGVIRAATEIARLPDQDAVANRILGLAGFEQSDAQATSLSGGWQKRLMLAWGLAQEPDVLLLDEPTNHLDIHGVLWLESLLGQASFTWALISHDRTFIERTAKKTAELSPIYGGNIFVVPGGYNKFLEEKKAYVEARTQYKESLTNKVVRETAWLQRGPKARTTKAKSRIKSALKLTEELDQVKQSLHQADVQVDFTASGRKTKRLMEFKSVSMSFDERPIIKNLDLLLTPRLRLGLLGDNGSGKSTLLNMMIGKLTPQDGEIRQAPDLRCVMFDQQRDQLDMSWTLKQALSETGDAVIYRERSVHVASWAKKFRFEADQLMLPISQLSGGEQARVLIARLMLRPADVLMLDEPTNDLDLPTLDVLEESLMDFPGALVVVSHDRYLLQRVCQRYLALDGLGGWLPCSNYVQWERSLGKKDKSKDKVVAAGGKEKATSKLSYKFQREWDAMESQIMKAEATLEQCQSAAQDPDIVSNGAKLTAAFDRLKQAEKAVEKLYERWSELEAMQQ